ncbi:MAG: DnaJ domain-containing protein [Chitinophagales bacterium]
MNARTQIVLARTTEGKLLFKPLGYHKFLLGAFGFMLNTIPGMIAGLIIGSFFDMQFVVKSAGPKHPDMRLNFLMLSAFVLQISGMDKKIPRGMIQERLRVQFGEQYIENRMLFFGELLRQRIQVEAICEQLHIHATDAEKDDLLKFLFQIGAYPNTNTEKIILSVEFIAHKVDISKEKVQSAAAQFRRDQTQKQSGQRTQQQQQQRTTQQNSGQKNTLYTLLQVQEGCSYTELRRAYYKMAKKYHPDSNPNASADEHKRMQEKLKNIIRAYEEIKVQRGWK